MSELIFMPAGFRFEPTDEELISSYLLRKVMGLPLSWNGILERDLYGESTAPWDVFRDIDESSFYWHTKKDDDKTKGTKKIIYLFTKLVKVGPNSKRIARKAGCGTWDGQTGPRKIRSSYNGEIIGSTRMLTYQHANKIIDPLPGASSSGSSSDSFFHWIMHEYSLDGVFLNHELNKDDLVLCKITRCLRENDGRHMRQILNDKRLGEETEECEWEDAWDQKKMKSSYGKNNVDEIDKLLAGLESIKNWNIDALFQGLDAQPLAEDY